MSDTARFALALDGMDGVGRVTAGRVLSHFATYEDLLRYPREQILARIKGVPRAETLVSTLFDRTLMQQRLDEAARHLEALHQQRVQVVTAHDAVWPARFEEVPRGARPFLLYAFGHRSLLSRYIVSFFAQAPLSPASFERAQDLVQHLLSHEIVPLTGTEPGFDVVVHKRCYAGQSVYPSMLITATGMARVAPPMRPTISAVVRAGGLLLSPFPMTHGPFEHDKKDRALIQAALAHASVFVEPQPDTPAWLAMTWALEAGLSVFAIAPDPSHLPESVHPLHSNEDFDWVIAAVQGSERGGNGEGE